MSLSFIKKALPWIGTAIQIALPGPIGILAKNLTDALGKPVKPTADDLTNAVTEALANPDQLAKLKQIDNDFAVQMQTLNVKSLQDFEQLAVDDRANARNREIQVRDWMPKVLGSGVVSGFIVATFLIITGHAKVDSVLAGTLIGYLSAKAELVLTYYFGSSAGSDRKTELLAQNNKQ